MSAANNGTVWDRPSKPWSLPGGRVVTSADASRDAWLEARKAVIGGSDIANLFGVGYSDEWAVWADKTGRAPERAATAAMDRGRLMEQGIIDLWVLHYADFPIELRRAGLVVSRRWPHLGATVDRLSICPRGRCVIEAKSQADSSEWSSETGEDEVPVKFQFQGQAQLAATGRDHVHFVVMGPRFVPFHRVMGRDDELQAVIGDKVEAWWDERVIRDVAPPATAKSSGLLKTVYPAAAGMKYVLDDDELDLAAALRTLKADRDAATTAYDDTLAQLQARVGQATEILWPDGDEVFATWNPTRTIDGVNKEFRAAHPDLVAAYSVEQTVVDTKALAADHPELLDERVLRHRRTWSMK